VLLAIDYGFPRREYYHPQRLMGTLMCHYRHRAHADPLWLPGLNDITAHVDFTAMADAAHAVGLDVLGYTTQAHFLMNCGLLDQLGAGHSLSVRTRCSGCCPRPRWGSSSRSWRSEGGSRSAGRLCERRPSRAAVGWMAMNLAAVEIKAFVPAKDFGLSKQFYLDLGFEIPWSSDDLAYVRHGETSFLLQAFDEPGFASNYQMHMLVENVDDWHAHVVSSALAQRYGVRVGAPEDQPWAMRDFTLFDPSGVVWRIAQNLPRP
jgi:hypothetical protein